MYALTRRTKLSLLATVPPFALNILHAGTHTLCGPLDVFVRTSARNYKCYTDFVDMDVIRRNSLYLSIPCCFLALAFCLSWSCFHFRLVFWYTKLLGHNHTSFFPDCRALVWRPIWISSSTRKLQHARISSRTCTG